MLPTEQNFGWRFRRQPEGHQRQKRQQNARYNENNHVENRYPLNIDQESQIKVRLGAAGILDNVPIGGYRQEAPLVALDVVFCVDLRRQVRN